MVEISYIVAGARTHSERVEIDWRCRRLNEAHLRLFAPFNYKCLPSRSSSIIDESGRPCARKKAERVYIFNAHAIRRPGALALQRESDFGFWSGGRLLICMVTRFFLRGCTHIKSLSVFSRAADGAIKLQIQSAVHVRRRAAKSQLHLCASTMRLQRKIRLYAASRRQLRTVRV